MISTYPTFILSYTLSPTHSPPCLPGSVRHEGHPQGGGGGHVGTSWLAVAGRGNIWLLWQQISDITLWLAHLPLSSSCQISYTLPSCSEYQTQSKRIRSLGRKVSATIGDEYIGSITIAIGTMYFTTQLLSGPYVGPACVLREKDSPLPIRTVSTVLFPHTISGDREIFRVYNLTHVFHL